MQDRAVAIQEMLDKHSPEALPPRMHARIAAITTSVIIKDDSNLGRLGACGIASLMQHAANPDGVKARWENARAVRAAAREVLESGNSRVRVE